MARQEGAMPRGNYRLRLVRGSDEFEAEGDKAFVLAMLQRFQAGAAPGKALALDVAAPSARRPGQELRSSLERPSAAKPVAVGEFIRQLAPKKHTDMVLAFGYYLERYGEMKDFASADINRCYYDAKLEPSNTSQMITQNIKGGFIMKPKIGKASGHKRFTLTQTGENKIRALLSKVK
jgi:hypothetical protein